MIFAQVPDTTTLEKKARYHTEQLKDNKTRAITPLHLRKAFNAVTNLALANVIPDLTTHPKSYAASSTYPDGISMFQITKVDGWPFDGTLLVEKSKDGQTMQTITASTNSTFIDQRKRTNFINVNSVDWTPWDIISTTSGLNPPVLKPGESFSHNVFFSGLTAQHRIKRIYFSSNQTGIILQSGKVEFNSATVIFTNSSLADIDLFSGLLTVYAEY
ncbi:hypothetical protein GCM10011325_27270 [Dyadobacter sediminis]|nr:hypothetical protein GCM10011325_27270 [Dyadobacter sediminis]